MQKAGVFQEKVGNEDFENLWLNDPDASRCSAIFGGRPNKYDL